MTVDPTRATDAADGGDPTGTGTPAATDPNARETEAQRIARLEAALEQSKAEKSNYEATKRELDEARDRLAQLEGAAPPPTAAPPADRIQKLAAEIAGYQSLVAADPNNFAAERMLRAAQAEAAEIQWQAILAYERPKLLGLAEPVRSRAIELLERRYCVSAQQAQLMAEGLVAREGNAATEAERKRREAADAAAAEAARLKPDTGGGSGSEPAHAQKRVITGSEYNRRTATRTPDAVKLAREVEQGAVEVNWTQ